MTKAIYTNTVNGASVTLTETKGDQLVIHIDGCDARVLTLDEAEDLSHQLDIWIDRKRFRISPPPEQFTCATGHLAAERTLRIIEKATRRGESISNNTIEMIRMLVDQAGVTNAKNALNEDVPF